MDNIDQILSDNYEQLDILKNELVKLKEIKNNINKLIGSNNQLPVIFKEKFNQIIEVTNSYTKTLSDAATIFVDGNNELLAKNNINFEDKIIQLSKEIRRLVEVDFYALFNDLETKFLENSKVEIGKELIKLDEKADNFQSNFEDKIIQLSKEITRLLAVDFYSLFNNLETKFLENSKVEIGKELIKFDEKANNFQSKNDELGIEITRLSEIDLEAHFDRHQNKLSEIFNAINSINSALSNISSNINKIIQNLGEIEQILSKNHRENNVNFELIKQNQANDKKELLTKIDESNVILNALIAQNELFKKDINFNKKISFAILFFILLLIVLKFVYFNKN